MTSFSNFSSFTTDTVESTLPDGFMMRNPRMDDLENVVDMLKSTAMHDEGLAGPTLENVRSEWQKPQMDISQNAQVVTTPYGRVVGYCEGWASAPERVFYYARVHPNYRKKGIGTALMQWAEERSRQIAAEKCPPDVRVVMQTQYDMDHDPSRQLFLEHGMGIVRYVHSMVIELNHALQEPALPEGIIVRPYRHPHDLGEFVKAILDSFKDHWGVVIPPFEEEVAEWGHDIDHDPNFDTGIWFMAFDEQTGNLAGVSTCRIPAWEDPNSAYIGTIGVLRDYRRRGIGTYLLRRTFQACYERNMPVITLTVDADSLTGATQIYERAGMKIKKTEARYEKELRPGRNTMTLAISDEPLGKEI